MAMLVFWWLGAGNGLPAQQPPVHYFHQGVMPPGAIGSRQLQRGGPLPGFFQPVEIKAPPGALISLAVANQFDAAAAGPAKGRLSIGAVYRLRVTNIRLAEGAEVFPTIEVIDRLYAAARSATPLRHPRRHHRGRPEAGHRRQVRHPRDLPRRPAPRLAGARRSAEHRTGSRRRRARTRWRWPTAWDGPWRSCVWGRGCRTQSEASDPSFFFGSPPFAGVSAGTSLDGPAARPSHRQAAAAAATHDAAEATNWRPTPESRNSHETRRPTCSRIVHPWARPLADGSDRALCV